MYKKNISNFITERIDKFELIKFKEVEFKIEYLKKSISISELE